MHSSSETSFDEDEEHETIDLTGDDAEQDGVEDNSEAWLHAADVKPSSCQVVVAASGSDDGGIFELNYSFI